LEDCRIAVRHGNHCTPAYYHCLYCRWVILYMSINHIPPNDPTAMTSVRNSSFPTPTSSLSYHILECILFDISSPRRPADSRSFNPQFTRTLRDAETYSSYLRHYAHDAIHSSLLIATRPNIPICACTLPHHLRTGR
jgi:hypothetical protein